MTTGSIICPTITTSSISLSSYSLLSLLAVYSSHLYHFLLSLLAVYPSHLHLTSMHQSLPAAISCLRALARECEGKSQSFCFFRESRADQARHRSQTDKDRENFTRAGVCAAAFSKKCILQTSICTKENFEMSTEGVSN